MEAAPTRGIRQKRLACKQICSIGTMWSERLHWNDRRGGNVNVRRSEGKRGIVAPLRVFSEEKFEKQQEYRGAIAVWKKKTVRSR